jgi:hypothetical protein
MILHICGPTNGFFYSHRWKRNGFFLKKNATGVARQLAGWHIGEILPGKKVLNLSS